MYNYMALNKYAMLNKYAIPELLHFTSTGLILGYQLLHIPCKFVWYHILNIFAVN